MKCSYTAMYNITFWLFTISGLCDGANCNLRKRRKGYLLRLMRLLDIPLFALHLFFNICMFKKRSFIHMALANISMTIVTGIHRFGLHTQMHGLKKLSEEINATYAKVNRENNKSKLYMVYLWATFSTLMCIPLFVNSTLTVLKQQPFRAYFSDNIANFLYFAYIVTFIVCFLNPLNTFAIYYTLICQQLASILKTFKKSIKPSSKNNCMILWNRFVAIKSVTALTDKLVNSFVFYTVGHYAAIMYFAVTMIMNPHSYGDGIQRSTIYIVCFNSFLSFLAVTISASRVNEMFSRIANKVERLPECNSKSVVLQLRLFISADRRLMLTVWDIVPVKRSFIMGAFGTFFTYCILFYNLQSP